MPEYRGYLLNPTGHIQAADVLTRGNDEEAIAASRAVFDASRAENPILADFKVRQGARLVRSSMLRSDDVLNAVWSLTPRVG